MRAFVAILAVLVLTTASSCGRLGDSMRGSADSVRGSALNPFNWFGRSRESRQRSQAASGEDAELIAAVEAAAARPDRRRGPSTFRPELGDYRILVHQVTGMSVDRVPGGAIVRATGLPRSQGYWDAELIAAPLSAQSDGTLVFEFRVFPPLGTRQAGTAPSREVTVARYVSDQTLAGVRQIVVVARQNSRAAGR